MVEAAEAMKAAFTVPLMIIMQEAEADLSATPRRARPARSQLAATHGPTDTSSLKDTTAFERAL